MDDWFLLDKIPKHTISRTMTGDNSTYQSQPEPTLLPSLLLLSASTTTTTTPPPSPKFQLHQCHFGVVSVPNLDIGGGWRQWPWQTKDVIKYWKLPRHITIPFLTSKPSGNNWLTTQRLHLFPFSSSRGLRPVLATRPPCLEEGHTPSGPLPSLFQMSQTEFNG